MKTNSIEGKIEKIESKKVTKKKDLVVKTQKVTIKDSVAEHTINIEGPEGWADGYNYGDVIEVSLTRSQQTLDEATRKEHVKKTKEMQAKKVADQAEKAKENKKVKA